VASPSEGGGPGAEPLGIGYRVLAKTSEEPEVSAATAELSLQATQGGPQLSDVAITVASMKPQANALALIVSDIAASVDFYRRLGLDFGDVTSAHIECELMPGFKLMLDDAANAKVFYPDWTRPTGGAHTALAFEFGSPSEVDEIYRELADVGLGSAHEPFDAPWGHRIATVRDPDGNNVDLYARLS
jgi:catechol 2,3-dioxygenase-like lactoylglutathione lyase family enzyme